MRLSTAVTVAALSAPALSAPNFLRHHSGRVWQADGSVATTTVDSATAEAIKRRQLVPKRTLLDICAAVDVDALAVVGLAPLLNTVTKADAEVCLCASLFPLSLEAFAHAGVGVTGGLLGQVLDVATAATASAKLGDYVHNHGRHCTYPSGATPFCSPSDPCDFRCPQGRVKSGDACVCPAGLVECNGKCAAACSSAIPRLLKSRLSGTGLSAYEEAQAKCAREDADVCGMYNSASGWECLKTKTNLESCGACTIPHPFVPASKQRIGVDCSAISNADDVLCVDGGCVIKTCKAGYAVALDKRSCVRINTTTANRAARDHLDSHLDSVTTDASDNLHSGTALVSDYSTRDVTTEGYLVSYTGAKIDLRHITTSVISSIVADLDTSVHSVSDIRVDLDSLVDSHIQAVLIAYGVIHADSVIMTKICTDVQAHLDASLRLRTSIVSRDALVSDTEVDCNDVTSTAVTSLVASLDKSVHTVSDIHTDLDALVTYHVTAALAASGYTSYHVDSDLFAGICANVRSRLDAALVLRSSTKVTRSLSDRDTDFVTYATTALDLNSITLSAVSSIVAFLDTSVHDLSTINGDVDLLVRTHVNTVLSDNHVDCSQLDDKAYADLCANVKTKLCDALAARVSAPAKVVSSADTSSPAPADTNDTQCSSCSAGVPLLADLNIGAAINAVSNLGLNTRGRPADWAVSA